MTSTVQNLRMIEAARLLGVEDPERFRTLAKRAGIEGRRHWSGRILWSEADVRAVRSYAEQAGVRLR